MKPSPELLIKINQTPLFEGLPSVILAEVQSRALRRNMAEGEVCFFQGDPADSVYFLAEGRVKLFQVTPDGQQVLMRFIGPGSLFGAIALVANGIYPLSAQANGPSSALYWKNLDLLSLIDKSPRLALNAFQVMAGHVLEYQDRFRELATERVERRVARAILRLASQTGVKVPEGVLLNLPITRQDLAEMTGTTLFTVSRILSQWETQGLILSGREKITIRFPHGLVSIAEDLHPKNSEI